jgi:hypothetical protein
MLSLLFTNSTGSNRESLPVLQVVGRFLMEAKKPYQSAREQASSNLEKVTSTAPLAARMRFSMRFVLLVRYYYL